MKPDFDIDAMRDRLRRTLEEKGLSKRAVSKKADLGPGFLHSILNEGKEPSISNLARICNAADVSLSYIIYGFELSRDTERLIALIEAHPEKRDGILALLAP